MGFCTDEQYRLFLKQATAFEQHLVEDGIVLVEYWFSVSDEEQEHRFRARIDDPLKQWKLSPMDLASRTHWVDYSRAKDAMFAATDLPETPWWVVEADDKRRAPRARRTAAGLTAARDTSPATAVPPPPGGLA